jgi:hypothetical protein
MSTASKNSPCQVVNSSLERESEKVSYIPTTIVVDDARNVHAAMGIGDGPVIDRLR